LGAAEHEGVSVQPLKGVSGLQLESLVAQPPPLRKDESGVVRIGKTRVRLETVINAFKAGASPEEILLKYPSLSLTDIYAVITYYLWHQDEVESYLQERQSIAQQVQQENEKRFNPDGVRLRLLSRRGG
jgi:uncharacterized protein (DUF433 family)